MSKPVVLIAEELSPATVEALGPDFEIRSCNGADRAELLPAIADVDAILVRSATKVDAEALAAAGRLKVVARAGVGLDNVDVRAATQSGVMVVNAPTSNIVSAAELAIGLLLAESDFISVHLPKTPETIGLIGSDELAKAKPSMVLVNAARGGIVDEDALFAALKEGRIAGAGIDVFAKEPCTDMKSASANRVSRSTSRTPICAARPACTYGSYAITFMPKAESRCATSTPMRPSPTMPTVFS